MCTHHINKEIYLGQLAFFFSSWLSKMCSIDSVIEGQVADVGVDPDPGTESQ